MLKEMLIKKIKKCVTDNIVGIGSGMIVGIGLGAVIGLGVNCKITKKLSPAKKSALVALGALGEMITSISENLR